MRTAVQLLSYILRFHRATHQWRISRYLNFTVHPELSSLLRTCAVKSVAGLRAYYADSYFVLACCSPRIKRIRNTKSLMTLVTNLFGHNSITVPTDYRCFYVHIYSRSAGTIGLSSWIAGLRNEKHAYELGYTSVFHDDTYLTYIMVITIC
jgi:hypothetical protein